MGQGSTALGLVLVTGVVACRVGPGHPQSATSAREGVFDYWAEVQRYELHGIVRMTADTVVLEPRIGSCRPPIAPPDRLFARYVCAGPSELGQLELRIHRQNPQLSSKWQATFKVKRQRLTCAKDAATDAGICMRYENEEYEETVTLTGPLRIRPQRGKPPNALQ